jgi:hypothetical protein
MVVVAFDNREAFSIPERLFHLGGSIQWHLNPSGAEASPTFR